MGFLLREQGGFMRKLLDISEAAEVLGIKPGTLYKWTCSRKLPHKKIGGALRFDPEELEDWIREQTVEPIAHQ